MGGGRWSPCRLWAEPPTGGRDWLIFHRAERAVKAAGRVVMRDRVIPGVALGHLCADLRAAGERMWADVSKGDWAGRSVDELSPQSLPAFRT